MASKKWVPLDLATLPDYRVIACDPSLGATGLVFVEINQSVVTVLDAQVISTAPTETAGWESTFEKAREIKALINHTMLQWVTGFGGYNLMAVHEAPPVGSGMLRTESTILAGYAFELIVDELDLTLESPVVPTAHKSFICGNGRATKKEHHAELKKLLPDILDGRLISNEALRDALSIALYSANRAKEA